MNARLRRGDRAVVRNIPALRPNRSLVEAARFAPTRALRVGFDDAHRRGYVQLDRFVGLLEELLPHPGAARMYTMLENGELDRESEGERSVDALWRPEDPRPLPQVWVEWDGRRYRLDFAFIEAALCLEYDGRDFHTIAADRHRDHDRDLALSQLGIETIRITAAMLRELERTRARILQVRAQRIALGVPPIRPVATP